MNSLQVVEMLNKIINDINEKIISLNDNLSEYDLQQQDILHYIENRKLNASQMSSVLKNLKNIRSKRRNIKNEIARYSTIVTKIKSGCLLNNTLSLKKEATYYEVKTNILENLGFSMGSKMFFGEIAEICNKVEIENIESPNNENVCIEADINTVSSNSCDTSNDDILEMESIFNHPEGKKVVLISKNGSVSKAVNFEKAVTKAIGPGINKMKPSEIVKNVSGAMKAIKLGNEYLGYKWKVE